MPIFRPGKRSNNTALLLHRREVVIALTIGAIALAPGCSHLRQQSALDASLDDLRRVLADAGDDELAQLCDQIGETARDMLNIHEQFLHRFNHRAADLRVDDPALEDLVTNYHSSITSRRNSLLALQDSLYRKIPAGQWPAVREQLLDTGRLFIEDAAMRQG